ncbi:hypothetical protein EMCG_01390 [[Emmonsia] crescens]|uniref:M protein repeat protein n=1 Tax=[Emmonsia] crescens TaxID=73230 RepID=A0A0G2J9S9_9EURO|nr:hypothetical protein EMCG_01390 [Emmonsia crescens UAMH 3008]
MADAEDKAKAEKLAAAKKRVAQLQKQQAKKAGKKAGGTSGGGEQSKKGGAASTKTKPDEVDTLPSASSPLVAQEEEQQQEEEKHEHPTEDASPHEPFPPRATEPEENLEPEPDTSAKEPTNESPSTRTAHARKQSLSVQSKIRSSSFRRSSIGQQTGGDGQPVPSPSLLNIKSPSLPPLSPDGDAVPEVFRKQALRLEELERENRRLERELEDVGARWKKSEEKLEDLRDANAELVEVRDRLGRAEKRAEEVERLKAEITALQRQNALLHSKSHRANSGTTAGNSESPPSALLAQLDSKSATIEAMELEISNLRAQLNSQSSTSSANQEQISALEDKLSRSEASLEKTQRELADTKHSLNRAVEKAVKEGVDKTSTETLIKNLERQLQEVETAKTEAEKKIETLEKKLQALGNLHKESENRNNIRLRERDKFEKDAAMLKRKLVTIENENLRLREERERIRKREASNVGDEEGLDELEDEERQRLEKRVRELEGENFDLRRGIWKERKRELSETGRHREGDNTDEHPGDYPSSAGAFDDVDLVGGLPGSGPDHARHKAQQQKHSSFTTVLSSGLAAFRGEAGSPAAAVLEHRSRAGSTISHGTGYSHNQLLAEKVGDDDGVWDDGDIDPIAYAQAQAAEEKRMRDERVKEINRTLKNWKGWRLDLVESRYGAQGAGVGLGEIFEV